MSRRLWETSGDWVVRSIRASVRAKRLCFFRAESLARTDRALRGCTRVSTSASKFRSFVVRSPWRRISGYVNVSFLVWGGQCFPCSMREARTWIAFDQESQGGVPGLEVALG